MVWDWVLWNVDKKFDHLTTLSTVLSILGLRIKLFLFLGKFVPTPCRPALCHGRILKKIIKFSPRGTLDIYLNCPFCLGQYPPISVGNETLHSLGKSIWIRVMGADCLNCCKILSSFHGTRGTWRDLETWIKGSSIQRMGVTILGYIYTIQPLKSKSLKKLLYS